LIGDSCVDHYHYGECNRVSPEASVLILKKESSKTIDGMAGNVNNSLKAMVSNVYFHTNVEKIVKNRYVDTKHNQHLLRVDEGESIKLEPFDDNNLKNIKYDALIISDYNKGFITEEVAIRLCEKFKDIPVFVDSKKKNLSCFSNCFLKINKKEFENSISFGENVKIIITLGPDGARHGSKVYKAEPVDVFDVSGAGDVFLSALAVCFLRTADIDRSIKVSNKCASFSVTKLGTYVLTIKDLKNTGVYDDLCV